MGLINSNRRATQEDHSEPKNSYIVSTSSSPSSIHNSKKKWPNLLPLFIALIIVAEIAFLGRLDLIKNAEFVNPLAGSFYQVSSSSSSFLDTTEDPPAARVSNGESCEEWLEREDHVVYSRDFHKEPVVVVGGGLKSCDVGCTSVHVFKRRKADAAIGFTYEGVPGVLRSMESSTYHYENDVALARRWKRI